MTLFAIGDELRAVLDLVDESAELPPIVEQWFAEIGDAEAEKLDAYAGLIRSLEGEAAVAKAEAEQFQAKAAARENAVKRLKDRVKLYLESTGRTKAVSKAGRTFAIQANGGKLPLVIDPAVKPEDLPREYQRITVGYDTEAIRDALEDGLEFPKTFARLKPRGNHLRVR